MEKNERIDQSIKKSNNKKKELKTTKARILSTFSLKNISRCLFAQKNISSTSYGTREMSTDSSYKYCWGVCPLWEKSLWILLSVVFHSFNSKIIVINLGNKKNEKRKKDLMYSGGWLIPQNSHTASDTTNAKKLMETFHNNEVVCVLFFCWRWNSGNLIPLVTVMRLDCL